LLKIIFKKLGLKTKAVSILKGKQREKSLKKEKRETKMIFFKTKKTRKLRINTSRKKNVK